MTNYLLDCEAVVKINIKRGLNRLAVVALFGWWLFIGYIVLNEYYNGRDLPSIEFLALVALGYPLVALGLLAVIIWIWSGFKTDD